jgi:hypothetical protein
VAIFLALAFATGAFGQGTPDPATIVAAQQEQGAQFTQQWLRSTDSHTVAWGAYLALRNGNQDVLPQLTSLAVAYPILPAPLTVTEMDAHAAMNQVLDAIIQLGGQIPAESAARLYPEFPVAAMILLSRGGPSATPLLLQFFRQDSINRLAWLAAGNLLLDSKPRGFAAEILVKLVVEDVVYVVEPGAGARAGQGISQGCGDALGDPIRAGWPPDVAYYFSTALQPGRTLLSGGTDPVYYLRVQSTNGRSSGFGECGVGIVPDEVRGHFLARLLGTSTDDPLIQSTASTAIEWRNDGQYLSEIAAFIEHEENRYTLIANKLVERGLLTAEERQSVRPTLMLEVVDHRRNRDGTLPTPELPANVKLGKRGR